MGLKWAIENLSVSGLSLVHNSTTDKQGGTTDEYYHLTETEHDTLTDGLNADLLHTHTMSAETLQGAYDLGETGPQLIGLDSTQLGIIVRDNATPLGSILWGVQDSAGATDYLGVYADKVQLGADVEFSSLGPGLAIRSISVASSSYSSGTDLLLFAGAGAEYGANLELCAGTGPIYEFDGQLWLGVNDTSTVRLGDTKGGYEQYNTHGCVWITGRVLGNVDFTSDPGFEHTISVAEHYTGGHGTPLYIAAGAGYQDSGDWHGATLTLRGGANHGSGTYGAVALADLGGVVYLGKSDHTTGTTVYGPLSFYETGTATLTVGAIADGYLLKRSGTTLTAVDPATVGVLAHGDLTGLTGTDHHAQYALLAGRSGGQTLIGGTAATDALVLKSTAATGSTDYIAAGVGTNGGTEAWRAINSGYVGFGIAAPLERVAIQQAGTATADTAIFSLTNSGNAAAMTNTRTSILWNQWYYDAGTPAVADAARITVGTEGNWTSTASTQDSYLLLCTALNGSVGERVRVASTGRVDITSVGDKGLFISGMTDYGFQVNATSGSASGCYIYVVSSGHGIVIDQGGAGGKGITVNMGPSSTSDAFDVYKQTGAFGDGFRMRGMVLAAQGTTDSPAMVWQGHYYPAAGANHDVEWRAFNDVTSDSAGLSSWTLQSRIDSASWTDHLIVQHNGATDKPLYVYADAGGCGIMSSLTPASGCYTYMTPTGVMVYWAASTFSWQTPSGSGLYEKMKIDVTTGQLKLGHGYVTPTPILFLDIAALTGAGTRNSHAIQWTGRSYDAGAHNLDWQAFVDVTSNAGANAWTLQTRLDAGSWKTRLAMSDLGLAVKTHDAFTGSGAIHPTGAVQTTTATAASLWTLTLSDTFAYSIRVAVTARNTDGTERGSWVLVIPCYREGGGAALANGGGAHLEFAATDNPAAWDVDADVSGNDVRVRVTGEAGKTINWVADVTHQAVSGAA